MRNNASFVFSKQICSSVTEKQTDFKFNSRHVSVNKPCALSLSLYIVLFCFSAWFSLTSFGTSWFSSLGTISIRASVKRTSTPGLWCQQRLSVWMYIIRTRGQNPAGCRRQTVRFYKLVIEDMFPFCFTANQWAKIIINMAVLRCPRDLSSISASLPKLFGCDDVDYDRRRHDHNEMGGWGGGGRSNWSGLIASFVFIDLYIRISLKMLIHLYVSRITNSRFSHINALF